MVFHWMNAIGVTSGYIFFIFGLVLWVSNFVVIKQTTMFRYLIVERMPRFVVYFSCALVCPVFLYMCIFHFSLLEQSGWELVRNQNAVSWSMKATVQTCVFSLPHAMIIWKPACAPESKSAGERAKRNTEITSCVIFLFHFQTSNGIRPAQVTVEFQMFRVGTLFITPQ